MKNITFQNQPAFSEHEADQARNAFKRDLVPKIEEFVSTHELFKDRKVDISFAQEGRTSLVAIIETEGKKYVFKITLTTESIQGEAIFLNAWEECAVPVPHVIEEGMLNQRHYIMLSFVDALVLEKVYSGEDMVSQDILKT